MVPFFAPIFAQAVALQVVDRTEGRYVKDRVERFEATTAPAVSLDAVAQRSTFTFAYAPQLTVLPLETTPRDLLVFHVLATNASYRVDRRTTLTLTSNFGVGTVNFRVFAQQAQLSPTSPTTAVVDTPGAPTPGTPTPGSGAPGGLPPGTATPGSPVNPGGALRPDVTDRKIRYYTFTTTAGVMHQLSKRLLLSGQLGATAASGRGAESLAFYAPLRAWTLGGTGTYVYNLDKANDLNSNLALIKTWSSNGNEAANANATETWVHRFNPRTSTTLTAGINVTRFSLANGLRGISVFPTGNAGVSHQAQLARGQLSLTLSAYSAPVLDPLRALVDPRVGVSGTLSYTRKKVGILASGNSALSIAPEDNDSGALNAYLAEARVFYRLAELTLMDVGARTTRQVYQGVTVVPTSWVAFVGVTLGQRAYIEGGPKPAAQGQR